MIQSAIDDSENDSKLFKELSDYLNVGINVHKY